MQVTTDAEALGRLRRMGGPTLVKRMIGLFLESMPRRVALAIASARNGDWGEVERAGHSLKSSAAYLGLRDVSDRAAAVELLASQGRGNEVPPLLQDLFDAVPDLERHLLGVLQGL